MRRLSRLQAFLALPLAVCGLLAGQAVVATPASAGISYLGPLNTSGAATLSDPLSATTDPNGNVYIADQAGHRVVKFNAFGHMVLQMGKGGAETAGQPGHLYYPQALVFTNNLLYVADGAHDVQVFNAQGQFQFMWGSHGAGDGQFALPAGIAADCAGHIYVTNSQPPYGVQVFDTSGHFLFRFGGDTSGVSVGIAVKSTPSSAGCGLSSIYVADEYDGRLVEYNAQGQFIRYIGQQGQGSMQFDHPDQIALDPSVEDALVMWVAESGTMRVQRIVSPDLGNKWVYGGEIAYGADHLSSPHGVTVDDQGHVYAVSTGDGRVYEYQDVPPDLDVADPGFTHARILRDQKLYLAAKYNQFGRTCIGLVRATVTVPPNAAHVFKLEHDDVHFRDSFVNFALPLSDRQAGWLKKAWKNGHKVTIDGKAVGNCAGERVSGKTSFRL